MNVTNKFTNILDGSILLKVSMPWINFYTFRSKQTFKHVNMGTIIVFNEQFVHKMKGLSPWLCFMENIREIYQYVSCFSFKFSFKSDIHDNTQQCICLHTGLQLHFW